MVKINVKNLSLDFGYKILFDKLNFSLQNGDKVTIVGDNGAGKSTLINLLAGKDYGQSGQINDSKERLIITGKNGAGKTTLLEIIYNLQKPSFGLIRKSKNSIIGHLKKFGLYHEHDFFSPLKNLSIGCRRKTQLAKIIAEGANILLLDEPTNHLDLVSLEQIENQLLSFSGIVIAVSHDRYFTKKMATKILRLGSDHEKK
jgi:ATPase subunit of ABC transporter with duplicated ATPase domains